MMSDRRDHGYSWFILLSSIVCNILFAAVVVCPSLFLVNITEAFDLSMYEAGWVISMNSFFISTAVAGAGILIEKFSCKSVGIVGSVLGCINLLVSSQAFNLMLFIAVYSLLSGIFISLTCLPPVVIIQLYFNKKRPLATGVSLIGCSIGNFAVLPVIALCIEHYGWRGALMIVAGLCLNMTVCMLTFTELKQPETELANDVKKLTENSTPNTGRKYLFNCSILTDVTFLMVAFSFALFQFGADIMFKVSTPRAELDLGLDKVTASGIVSVISIGAAISRFMSSMLTNVPCVSTLAMYAFSMFIGGIVIIVVAFVQTYMLMLIGAAVYGIMFGMTTTVQTSVLVDLLGVDKISRGQGLVFGITGTVYLVSVPFAGWIYDNFQSFSISFLIAGIVQCIGGLISLALLYKTLRKIAEKGNIPIKEQPEDVPIKDNLHVQSLDSLKWTPVLTGSIHSLASFS